jgi:pimeloyl-ACP methyl ester carboxylesterase
MKNKLKNIVARALAVGGLTLQFNLFATDVPNVTFHTVKVDGVNVFYREGGDPSRPTIVLLHGAPSSSHMFRDLIPKLALRYHVIAPDYPGFGYSDQPAVADFAYTFDHLAAVTDDLLNSLNLDKYSIYVQDYGAPVGFRLFVKHPEKIEAIITQNGNAYREGLGPVWAEFFYPYWQEKSAANEAKMRQLLTPESTKSQYITGSRNPANVSPDAWTFDQVTLDKPGNAEIELALFYDYQNNVKQYDQWHATLRQFSSRRARWPLPRTCRTLKFTCLIPVISHWKRIAASSLITSWIS